ncbi:MAG: hypothetical protein NTW49_13900 [Bacteroidia bacterium]|nr:hypothetical protein [Bacteroidia bacterium]
MRKILPLVFFICWSMMMSGQRLIPANSAIPMITASYAFDLPAKDMAARFGWNNGFGVSFQFKTKANWLISAEATYFFGNIIKEDSILRNLETSNGEVINRLGEYSEVVMTERGGFVGAGLSRLFVLSPGLPNSGIVAKLSAGFLEHKISIQNDGNNAPQLASDYLKGYDRLTNGFAMYEFIGYMYIGDRQYLNFFAGFEFYQAFTKGRRDFNFDTMQKDNKNRKDFLYGIRFGWIIPFYERQPQKFYTF